MSSASSPGPAHPFALLTYGCVGPGYVTDRYECDPEELARARAGDPVTLGDREVIQLKEGTTLFYPADRMAHGHGEIPLTRITTAP